MLERKVPARSTREGHTQSSSESSNQTTQTQYFYEFTTIIIIDLDMHANRTQLQQADSNSNISTYARTMPVTNTDADMKRSSNIIEPNTIRTPQSLNTISCRTIDQFTGATRRHSTQIT